MSPPDSARPGDAFCDENGVIWVLLDTLADETPWFVVSDHISRWHSRTEARAANLTPLVPALTPEGVDPVAEWKSAGADRRAVADELGVDCEIGLILDAIKALQAEVDGVRALHLPTPDASDPAQLRHAADIINLARPGGSTAVRQYQRNVLADELRAQADRFDAEAADRKLAREAAQTWHAAGWAILTDPERDAAAELALAGIRASRDAGRSA